MNGPIAHDIDRVLARAPVGYSDIRRHHRRACDAADDGIGRLRVRLVISVSTT